MASQWRRAPRWAARPAPPIPARSASPLRCLCPRKDFLDGDLSRPTWAPSSRPACGLSLPTAWTRECACGRKDAGARVRERGRGSVDAGARESGHGGTHTGEWTRECAHGSADTGHADSWRLCSSSGRPAPAGQGRSPESSPAWSLAAWSPGTHVLAHRWSLLIKPGPASPLHVGCRRVGCMSSRNSSS